MQLPGLTRAARALPAMALLAVTVSTSGCIAVFDSWDPRGLYDLRSANGDYVPAVVFSRNGSGGYTVTLLRGDLRLRGDHTFRMELDYIDEDATSETRYTQGISGEWSDDNDTIWLDYVDPESGDWASLAAFKRHNELEVNIPGAVSGASVRALFER